MLFKRVLDYPNYGWRSAFDELERMRRDMDRFMAQSSGRAYWPAHAGVFPLVNVSEDKDHFYIRSEMPGMQSEDINISATGKNMTISGERKIALEGENVRYHRREREDGKFSRAIALPNDIRVGKIEATYADGVLNIIIPKAEETEPRKISIK
jgi:HSP20 family protein